MMDKYILKDDELDMVAGGYHNLTSVKILELCEAIMELKINSDTKNSIVNQIYSLGGNYNSLYNLISGLKKKDFKTWNPILSLLNNLAS